MSEVKEFLSIIVSLIAIGTVVYSFGYFRGVMSEYMGRTKKLEDQNEKKKEINDRYEQRLTRIETKFEAFTAEFIEIKGMLRKLVDAKISGN